MKSIPHVLFYLGSTMVATAIYVAWRLMVDDLCRGFAALYDGDGWEGW